MYFSSLIFLFLYLPIVILGYYMIPWKFRNLFLLLVNLVFYGWGEPVFILIMAISVVTNYICGLFIDKYRNNEHLSRMFVVVSVVISLGLLGIFKYTNFLTGLLRQIPFLSMLPKTNIALPIGISFYTFQAMSYTIDVYRNDTKVQKSLINFGTYVSFFPQLIAGPIVRYKTIDQELFSGEPRRPELAEGVSRFAAGLAKKVLLANPCGALAETMILADSVAADPAMFAENVEYLSSMPVLGAWLGVAAYTLHIYLDFSAYSDMAIGMGRMLGLHYLENFNYPYISRSVTEFWRRWHMSLGTFFRDYVYIPLGGNRGSKLRVVFNTFVVWALTGLWHGASWNFVLWGLWFFVFLMIERSFLKKFLDKVPVVSNLYALIVAMLGWVLFRFTDLRLVWVLVKSLFGANGNVFSDFGTTIQLQSHSILLLVAAVGSTPLVKVLGEKIGLYTSDHGKLEKAWNVLVYSILPVVLLLLATANLVGDSYNPFIYFQF